MNAGEILAAFPKLRVLVVGDVCLDRWCRYDPSLSEPSRETGIPRTAVVSAEVTAGAAGTIANNLVALGTGRVAVLGVIGDDGNGEELTRALARNRIGTELLLRSPMVPTFTYTKLINVHTGIEDLPRIDFVYDNLPASVDDELVDSLRRAWPEFDVVLVSDQAETPGGGAVTANLRRMLTSLSEDRIVWVDSRKRPELFRGVILKPNRDEAQEALDRLGAKNYGALLTHTEARLLVITHGPEGVLLVDQMGESWVRTRPAENPVDICGAGDSFSAGAAMALHITGSKADAAKFGNLVASITIMKPGTGVATPAEVLRAAEAE
ncbi:MAG TPA: PfkB family carbohydrate kinase [Bryobacteraceae bacterium]|nr:PfkB family carbohydrate kinase [Bryobacteraceae bacterium]